jgi:hypothetical protein
VVAPSMQRHCKQGNTCPMWLWCAHNFSNLARRARSDSGLSACGCVDSDRHFSSQDFLLLWLA